MNKSVAANLLAWIDKHLAGTLDPRRQGKASAAGLWRYRVGDCRSIALIADETVTVVIFGAGYGKDIYTRQ